MSNCEKTTRQTQDTLQRQHLFSGLGMPWCPTRRAGGSNWGEGGLGLCCCPRDPNPDKRKLMDEWMVIMSKLLIFFVYLEIAQGKRY